VKATYIRMTTVLDDKMANFGKIQKEMGDLYSVKQGALAQFNENTLVKSVSTFNSQILA
jgi:hypothetical protein